MLFIPLSLFSQFVDTSINKYPALTRLLTSLKKDTLFNHKRPEKAFSSSLFKTHPWTFGLFQRLTLSSYIKSTQSTRSRTEAEMFWLVVLMNQLINQCLLRKSLTAVFKDFSPPVVQWFSYWISLFASFLWLIKGSFTSFLKLGMCFCGTISHGSYLSPIYILLLQGHISTPI